MTENIISIDQLTSQTKLSTQGRFPMLTVTLCGILMRMIITDQEHLLDSRATWYCLTELGEGVGSSNPKMLLSLLKRKEQDSRIFTNDEIILENFKGKESLPLANRGNTFVSLRGVLEILSKTELSSDIADNFQDEVFGHLLPSLALTGRAELPNVITKPVTPQFALPTTLPEALRAYAAEIEAKEKAQAERDETKALLAEEQEKVEALNEAVDNLERTKAWINDKKVASAMGTAGARAKECERLKKEVCKLETEIHSGMPTIRDEIRREFEEVWSTAREWCFRHKLPVYANEPKWTVSNHLADICMAHPDREQWHMNDFGTRLFPKWACDVLDKVYDDDSTFLIEYRTT